jgi:hypothetical protein
MLLAAAQFADQKDRIHHHARDNQRKEYDPEKQQDALAPIQDDPAHVQGNGQRDQTNPQAQKENDRSSSARNAHAPILPLNRALNTAGSILRLQPRVLLQR